ncbi:hypothetical protein SAMN05216567_103225 [Variovorax sp. OK605]|jgi:hypothetical protein|uniref:hypothetical protein n=1 Tax=Variovorax sp. OK605 TaxID=1855317 RepID=UPI0008E7A293|nr:hypothetical protein [Variovorax sp. OK605]SFO89601.1 hypothetical protein SAMN05216567_103225 [Variovorax sp. OK605]
MTTSPWTYVIGPFVGAFLAFGLARMYDANRRFNERLAAGNLALLTLKNQFNDFTLFRLGFAEDCRRITLTGDEPIWALVRPNFMRYGDYEFDYKEVAFLFESGARPSAFDDIELAQMAHHDLIKMDEHRTATARETQRLVAKEAKVGEGLDGVEKIIGKAMVVELEMLASGLALRAADNEQVYLKAFRSLRSALREHIMQTWRYRVGYLWRMRHDATVEDMLMQLRPRLELGFNADELPPLPDKLQAAVNEALAARKAYKARAKT